MSHNKDEDHRRINQLDFSILLDGLLDPVGREVFLDDAIFCVAYLRKLRVSIFDAVFQGMRKKLPPVVILAMVLGALGMQESDIGKEMDKAMEEKEKTTSSILWTPGNG